MTCAENVLTLTPECFHRHVFLLPLHSSLISAFSLYSVTSVISVTSHSTRPISLSLFSICSNFSLYLTLLPLFFSNFPVFPASSVSLLSLFTLFFLRFPYFPLTLSCALKRFPLTTSRKTITTCAENVLTLTPDHAGHDVLLLTPTPEFPPQDKPGRWRGPGGMVAHDLVNGCQATA